MIKQEEMQILFPLRIFLKTENGKKDPIMLNYYKQKFLRQRITAILLLTLSLALLSSNWLVSTGSTKYDWSDYQDDLSSLSMSIDGIAGLFGLSIDTSSTARSVGYLLNGKITPIEGALIAKDLVPILNAFSDGSEESVALQIACILYALLVCLTILSGIHALVLHTLGKKYSGLLFSCLVTLLFIVALCSTFLLKRYDLHFRISLFSIASLICSILSSVYWSRLPLAEFVPNEKSLLGALLHR